MAIGDLSSPANPFQELIIHRRTKTKNRLHHRACILMNIRLRGKLCPVPLTWIAAILILLIMMFGATRVSSLCRPQLHRAGCRVSYASTVLLAAKDSGIDDIRVEPCAASDGTAKTVFVPKKTTKKKKTTTTKKAKRSMKSSPLPASPHAPVGESIDDSVNDEPVQTKPLPETGNKESTPEVRTEPDDDDIIEFYDVSQFLNANNSLPPLKSLSPSSISEFQNCPQSFFFQYILRLRQPRNAALAKGSMAHAALEQFLAIPVEYRNITVLHNFFRKAWSEHRTTDGYKELFPAVADEIDWGKHGLHLLTNYYATEPLVEAPNPVQRERWVTAKLGEADEQVLVRGIIDRLDLVRDDHNNGVATRIVDYKTGCAPNLKYSPAMNEKIRQEAFDQLIIYALLLSKSSSFKTTTTPLRYLRLLYLQSVDDGPAVVWDYDLGDDDKNTQLDAMEQKILDVYQEINEKLNSPDPFQAFAGCERSFCYCHRCRKRFAKGLVWEPPVT